MHKDLRLAFANGKVWDVVRNSSCVDALDLRNNEQSTQTVLLGNFTFTRLRPCEYSTLSERYSTSVPCLVLQLPVRE